MWSAGLYKIKQSVFNGYINTHYNKKNTQLEQIDLNTFHKIKYGQEIMLGQCHEALCMVVPCLIALNVHGCETSIRMKHCVRLYLA